MSKNYKKKIVVAMLSGVLGICAYTGNSIGINAEGLDNAVGDSVTENVNSSLNRASNGNFEGSEISNKSTWNIKPYGVSTIITDEDNSYGKIALETTDEYILKRIPTTPGKTYRVTADLKVATRNNAVPTGGYFTARSLENDTYGAVYNEIKLTDILKNWTSQSFEFVAQDNEALVGIVKYKPDDTTINTKKTEISIDNLVVVEKGDIDYKMVWHDEFNESDLDKDTWSYMPGTVARSEQQNYTTSKDNVYLKDGELVFKATKREKVESNPRRPQEREIKYDSGFINTSGKVDFLYGRIEMKAKLPKGQGAFPAFWLMGTSYGWPGGGEIDIMELIGAPTKERMETGDTDPTDNGRQSNKIVYGTPHFYYVNGDVDKDGSYDPYELGGNVRITEDFSDEYHIFGIDWTPERIDWYLDGVIYNSMNLSGNERLDAAGLSMNRPQIMKLNLATGGDWAGDAGDHLDEDETTMRVDWVRWYQNSEQKKAADEWYANAPKFSGLEDIIIKEGSNYDVLSGVSVDKNNYTISASIDDEYMYKNTGEMALVNTINKGEIANLKTGVYNVHYHAVPTGVNLNGDSLAQGKAYPTILKTKTLIVLPKEGITGVVGEKLSSIALPDGWSWINPEQTISENELYSVYFTTGSESKKARGIIVNIPVEIKDLESGNPSIENESPTTSVSRGIGLNTDVNEKITSEAVMNEAVSNNIVATGDNTTILPLLLSIFVTTAGILGINKSKGKNKLVLKEQSK